MLYNSLLDVRLTIAAPIETTGIQEAMDITPTEPTTVDASALNAMIRKSVYIAKATPYTTAISKKCENIEIEVSFCW